MNPLRQSTARTLTVGPCVSTADGFTAVTSLATAMDDVTTGIRISKNGAALAARHATVTATAHDADGYYKVVLDTTDSDTLGKLFLKFSNSAILPIWSEFNVVTAFAFDSFMATSGGWMPNASANSTGGVPVIGTGTNNFKSNSAAAVPIDWALISNPTASNTLSGTTISTNQSISQATTVLTTQTTTSVTNAVIVDWNLITNATATKSFTGTTISTSQTINNVTTAVGVNWALITNPTASNALTGTTINSNQSVSQATTVLTVQTVNTMSWAGIFNATASQALTATTIKSDQTWTAVNSVNNAVTVGTDNSTSTRNANIVSINSSASAASALSYATNDTNNRLTVTSTRSDWSGVYNSTASQSLSGTTIKSDQTWTAVNSVNNSVTVGIDNATSTRNTNVVSINSSTSAATALAYATNDSNNRLTVTATRSDWSGVYNGTASQSLSGTTIKSDQTWTAVNSVTNGVTVSVDNATSTRNSNLVTINGTGAVAELTTLINSQTQGSVTTTASVTNRVGVDWSLTTNATANINLSGTTISTNQSISAVTTLNNMVTGSGTSTQFTVTALANAPSGGGGGGATTFNATQIQQIVDASLQTPTNATTATATSLYALASAADTNTTNIPPMITGSGTAAKFTTAALVNAPSGTSSTTITVTPITSTVSAGEVVSDDFVCYQNASQTFTFAIVDGDGDPVDLSAKTVRFTASLPSDYNTPLVTHDNSTVGGVAISGTSHNTVVLSLGGADTEVAPQFLRYGIWNVTDDAPLASGNMTVLEISQET